MHWGNIKHLRSLYRILGPKPKTLYKYHTVNQYFFDLLDNKRLWAGSAIDLNDPYDCNFEISHEFFRTKYLDKIKPSEIGIKSEGAEEDKKIWDSLASVFDQNFRGALQSHRRSQIGVCCFSQNTASELMWSHYANAGKGVCLGFSFSDNPGIEKKIVPIKYSNNAIHVHNEIDRFKALFQKRLSWGYEKEWRILADVGHIHFEKSNLVSITFGPRISKTNMENISQACKKNGYDPIFQICDYNKDGLKIIRL
jgi:hypothetical protein